jgi:hypothetical protein
MYSWVNEISESEFNESIPIKKILTDSFYYPACAIDLNLPFHYINQFNSYVYCDYGIENVNYFNLIILNSLEKMKEKHANELKTEIVYSRDVSFSELFPYGWQNCLENFGPRQRALYDEYVRERRRRFGRAASCYRKNFIKWLIFKTKINDVIIKRWSLFYIGNDGVGTYYALYYTVKTHAKGVAIIQPGYGFGGNWTVFNREGDCFHKAIMGNPYGLPEIIVYGGIGDDRYELNWSGFNERIKTIRPYYKYVKKDNFNGCVSEWKRG